MRPQVGPLPAFFVGWLIAAALAGGSGVYFMRRSGMRPAQIALSVATLIASLLLGSKILYLIEAWASGSLDSDTMWAGIFSARLRLPGGILLAIAQSLPTTRLMGLRFLRVADAVVPVAGLMIVGIRVGCFLEGCCYGPPSSLPWAMRFPAASEPYNWQLQQGLIWFDANASLPIHPLQIYFGMVGLGLFMGLSGYERSKRYDGEVLLLFGFLYIWSTWFLEHLRAQPHVLTQQVVLLAAILITMIGTAIEWGVSGRQRRVIATEGTTTH